MKIYWFQRHTPWIFLLGICLIILIFGTNQLQPLPISNASALLQPTASPPADWLGSWSAVELRLDAEPVSMSGYWAGYKHPNSGNITIRFYEGEYVGPGSGYERWEGTGSWTTSIYLTLTAPNAPPSYDVFMMGTRTGSTASGSARIRGLDIDSAEIFGNLYWVGGQDATPPPTPDPPPHPKFYDPSGWQRSAGKRWNNCYNWACGQKTDDFAQPGRANPSYTPKHGWFVNPGSPDPESGRYRRFSNDDITCQQLTEAALADGLQQLDDCDHHCPVGSTKAALSVDHGNEYHWYRQHDDDTWSHKPGKYPPQNRIHETEDEPINDFIDVRKSAALWGFDVCENPCFCCPGNALHQVGAAGAQTALTQIQAAQVITVATNTFSGIPDPYWEITDPEEITAIKDLLDGLPPSQPLEGARSGWAGFVLDHANVPDFPDLIYVEDGIIETTENQTVLYFQDANGLEAWLLARMPDSDGDGLDSFAEIDSIGTNHANPDTDLDGFRDDVELTNTWNPVDPTSPPMGCFTSQIVSLLDVNIQTSPDNGNIQIDWQQDEQLPYFEVWSSPNVSFVVGDVSSNLLMDEAIGDCSRTQHVVTCTDAQNLELGSRYYLVKRFDENNQIDLSTRCIGALNFPLESGN